MNRSDASRRNINASAPDVDPTSESDHRIKNSLGLLASLFRTQARQAEAEAVQDALLAAAGRVDAVAAVHRTLHHASHRGEASSLINLDDYLSELVAGLQASVVDETHTVLHVAIERVIVRPRTARYLGLVVAELVTNALRHGLTDERCGAIHVMGRVRHDGSYALSVTDDGAGLPADFDTRSADPGYGLRLVRTLSEAAGAQFSVNHGGGASFTLVFRAPAERATA